MSLVWQVAWWNKEINMDMLEFQSRIKDLISIHDTVYVVLKSTEVPGVKNITTDSVVAVCNCYATALRIKEKIESEHKRLSKRKDYPLKGLKSKIFIATKHFYESLH